jgi:hypothetical protein
MFNYLKEIVKSLGFQETSQHIDGTTYRAFFFGEISRPLSPNSTNPNENLICAICRIEKGTMGFTLLGFDPQIITTTLTYCMIRLSKRMEIGGALGGELLEMICTQCGATIPEYFGTGMKHFCVSCGYVNIFY